MPHPKDDLENLKERIEAAKVEVEPAPRPAKSGSAYNVAVELGAGVLVGGFCGYYLDKVLATEPIFFIVCLLFGSAAGFYNVYRQATREEPTDQSES